MLLISKSSKSEIRERDKRINLSKLIVLLILGSFDENYSYYKF